MIQKNLLGKQININIVNYWKLQSFKKKFVVKSI